MSVYQIETVEGLTLKVIATDFEITKLLTERKIVMCRYLEEYRKEVKNEQETICG